MKPGRLIILLVEDDDNDIFFVRHATEASGARHAVYGVHDGEEATSYLTGAGQFADRHSFPLPNVILTDIKMPRMGGFELLRWLRTNSQYAVIPTIVYSSSHLEEDVREAYKSGANSFIRKPCSIEEMVEILRIMYQYWSRCECPVMTRAQ